MPKSLQSWTRKAWQAIWLQHRRRARARVAPEFAIVLGSDGHGHLTWTLTAPSELAFNIYQSDDGVTWGSPYGGADAGALSQDCSGAAGYFRICQCDEAGVDLPPYSNVVSSDGLVQAITLLSDGHGRLAWGLTYPIDMGFHIHLVVGEQTSTFALVPPGASSWDCSGVAGEFFINPYDPVLASNYFPFSNRVVSDGL